MFLTQTRNNKKILLIENDPAHQEMVRRSLESFTTTELAVLPTGEEGIEYLEKNTHPNLILLDLNLGKMSGFDFIKHIKNDEKTKAIDIVVLTTSTDPEEKQYVIELGASGCYTKASDAKAFDETLQIICEFWLN